MKRQTMAALGGGLACLALLASAAAAGAAPVQRLAPRHPVTAKATPTIKITPNANLKAGEKVKVTGSGWPKKTKLIVAECNFDGAGPGALNGSCDTSALATPTTSSTGTFSTSFTVVGGTMSAGKSDDDCAQGKIQAEHSVQCIIGAAQLNSTTLAIEKFAYGSIFFTAPKVTFKYTKSTKVDGKQTYTVKVTEAGGYTKPSVGGFEIIGAVGKTKPWSTKCQSSRNDKSTWSQVKLPACTHHYGEEVEIKWNGKNLAKVEVSATPPGAFSYTIDNVKAGKHAFEALGLTSSEKVTATADVP
jgi:Neocarzinostatin family